MSTKQNVQTVKDFFAAAFGGDRERMLARAAATVGPDNGNNVPDDRSDLRAS